MTHTSAAQSSLAGRNFNCFTHTHTHTRNRTGDGRVGNVFFPPSDLENTFEIWDLWQDVAKNNWIVVVVVVVSCGILFFFPVWLTCFKSQQQQQQHALVFYYVVDGQRGSHWPPLYNHLIAPPSARRLFRGRKRISAAISGPVLSGTLAHVCVCTRTRQQLSNNNLHQKEKGEKTKIRKETTTNFVKQDFFVISFCLVLFWLVFLGLCVHRGWRPVWFNYLTGKKKTK